MFGAGGTERLITRFLKPGFHHCWVCLLDEDRWILADGVLGVPRLREMCGDAFDLAGHYRNLGMAVIVTEQRETAVPFSLVANNCVGMVKSLLCIGAPLVWTPWQLYRYLSKDWRHGI